MFKRVWDLSSHGGYFIFALIRWGMLFCRVVRGPLLLIGLPLLFLCLLQSFFVRCEYVRVCYERCSPSNLVAWFARESFCLIVMEWSRDGVQLGNVRARKELPVGAHEDAPCVGCDFDVGDLLPGLSSTRGKGVEACFDGVGLGGKHSVGRRILYGDDEVCVLGRCVLLGVREDIRPIRGGSEGVGGLGVCCVEFPN